MTVGVDVSKDSLAVATPARFLSETKNSGERIADLLAQLEPGSTIAMEATGKYHLPLANAAFSGGFRVIVFNPKDVLYYARSISPRAKTDRVDAQVIASYALVRCDHHSYQPKEGTVAKLASLVKCRASLVCQRVALQNRLRESPESASYLSSALKGLLSSTADASRELNRLARTIPQYKLLKGIPGVGPITGAYLAALLGGTRFSSSDAFVAFIGLDVRVKQSGKRKGKAGLSKRGDPEARRLLYLAAMAASRQAGPFHSLWTRYLERSFSTTAAYAAVARKIARTAWSIYTKNTPYDPDRVLKQPAASAGVNDTQESGSLATPTDGPCPTTLTGSVPICAGCQGSEPTRRASALTTSADRIQSARTSSDTARAANIGLDNST